ncbi:MAG TPA: ATP synthase F0 subunit B [Thermoanaerobaculia bacterium]|nr:ATP synthase F0 subunit B [Thermoanaerobaculia bacterium]
MTNLLLLLSAEGEHAAGPLGIPNVIWQAVNLIGFLAALFYFVARPMTRLFRQRQLDIERRLQEAQERRAEAARLESEIHERMARLDRDVAEILARGSAEGEAARAELIGRADQDAENVRRQAEEEINRRLEAARQELRRTAAELTATAARELVAAQMTEEDRRRLLTESIVRLESRS